MSDEVRFCQRCGNRLSEKMVDGKLRPHCSACGQVLFLDPKVAVVVLVTMDGKLALVRRAIEPALGRWSFPSGYVDRGEVLEDAAVREVREETGVDVRVDRLVGVYSGRGIPLVLAAYSAIVTSGSLRPGDEVQELGLFSPDELPPLPFPHDDQILEDWKAFNKSVG